MAQVISTRERGSSPTTLVPLVDGMDLVEHSLETMGFGEHKMEPLMEIHLDHI